MFNVFSGSQEDPNRVFQTMIIMSDIFLLDIGADVNGKDEEVT